MGSKIGSHAVTQELIDLFAPAGHTHSANISGSGTVNRIAKFTSINAVGNSNISDDGGSVTITGTNVNIVNAANFSASPIGNVSLTPGTDVTLAPSSDVYILPSGTVDISRAYEGVNIHPIGNTYISPSGSVYFQGNGNIDFANAGNANIHPAGYVWIHPTGNVDIQPIGDTHIHPSGSVTISPSQNVTINPLGYVDIKPLDTVYIHSNGSIDMYPSGSVSIHPHGNVDIHPDGNITIDAYSAITLEQDTYVEENLYVSGSVFTDSFTDYSSISQIVGWASYTTKQIYYMKIGKLVIVEVALIGISDNDRTNFTVPYAPLTVPCNPVVKIVDGGTNNFGHINLPAGSVTGTCFPSSTTTVASWTTTGTKTVLGTLMYVTD